MAMYSSTRSVHDIDFNSLELMCIYIGEYRCFSETGINLNARYHFQFLPDKRNGTEWPSVKVSRNKEHIDLFQEYGVNLKIICGINGVGKTTILQLLRHNQHASNDRYFVLFKDKDDKYLCTKDILLSHEGRKVQLTAEWSSVNLSNLTSSLVERNVDDYGILRQIASSYNANRTLFDFKDAPLFTHFNIDVLSEENNREVVERVLADEFGIRNDPALWSLWRDHPLVYCFLHYCQDSDVARRIQAEDIRSIHDLIAFFTDGVYGSTYNILHNKVRSLLFNKNTPARVPSAKSSEKTVNAAVRTAVDILQKEREPQYYLFSEYELIRDHWLSLEREAYRLFSLLLEVDISADIFDGLFYFRPVRLFRNGNTRELHDLSHGEYISVVTKYALYPRMLQTDGIWFDEDEVDKNLHPEWKRRFLHTYLDAVRDTRNMLADRYPDKGFGNKIYTVLLTTHSPFLLSDVPGEHVVYLEPSKNLTAHGLPTTEVRIEGMPNSFCGNIGEMYYSNFFMEETIGEFAKQKIEKALKELKGAVSYERMMEIRALFGMVGDSLLKSLLDEKLKNAKVVDAKD